MAWNRLYSACLYVYVFVYILWLGSFGFAIEESSKRKEYNLQLDLCTFYFHWFIKNSVCLRFNGIGCFVFFFVLWVHTMENVIVWCMLCMSMIKKWVAKQKLIYTNVEHEVPLCINLTFEWDWWCRHMAFIYYKIFFLCRILPKIH